MSRRLAQITFSVGGFLSVAASPVLAQQYELIELGTLGGSTSIAIGISENGTVVGWAQNPSSVKRAVLWHPDGTMTDLGTPPNPGVGEARAVNDAGQVAVVVESNPQSYRSYMWENGAWTPIGILPGLNDTIVDDIDSAGRIVGRSFILGPGDPDRAFIWEDGVFTELGTPGVYTVAFGVSDTGLVAGRTQVTLPGGGLGLRGFLWDNGQMTVLEPLPGDVDSHAYDVNDAGDVVGSSAYYTTQFFSADSATLWPGGSSEPIDLGFVPAPPGSCSSNPFWHKSIARAINNHDQIVGDAMCITSGASRAGFLWSNGVMHNLQDLIPPGSGWDITGGRDINDAGQIIGIGINPTGNLRAYLLQPLCIEDLTGDGQVDVNDLLLILSAWGDCPGAPAPCPADLDQNGAVDVSDLLMLLAAWGACG